jgi:hypothetical protein
MSEQHIAHAKSTLAELTGESEGSGDSVDDPF